MESQIKRLALEQGTKNVQQFAIKAGLPWSMAKAIWEGNIENRALKTLAKAATALGCKLEDLYKVS